MLHVLLTRLPSTTVDVSTLCALAASSELVGCDKINTERSAVVARVDNDMVQMERKQRAMDAFKHVDDNHDRQLGFEEFKKLLPHNSEASDATDHPEPREEEQDALARALFDQVDTDRSGEVSFHEFSRVFSVVGHFAKPTSNAPLPDKDDGGTLHRQRSTFDWAAKMFASVDSNGDGVISKSELRDLARNIYCARDGLASSDKAGQLRELTPVQELEVERIFDAADADNSGEIDCDEFIACANTTPFLLTGMQLLCVQEKLEQERDVRAPTVAPRVCMCATPGAFAECAIL
jgi:Ca2+-binding EF-hand superfamily protein